MSLRDLVNNVRTIETQLRDRIERLAVEPDDPLATVGPGEYAPDDHVVPDDGRIDPIPNVGNAIAVAQVARLDLVPSYLRVKWIAYSLGLITLNVTARLSTGEIASLGDAGGGITIDVSFTGATSLILPVPAGATLLSMRVVTTAGSAGSGLGGGGQIPAYVQVEQAFKLSNGAELIAQTFIENYVWPTMPIVWPGSPMLTGPRQGPGFTLQQVSGGFPGQEFNYAVFGAPGVTLAYRLLSLSGTLTTTATPGTRRPILIARRGGGAIVAMVAGSDIPISTFHTLTWAPNLPTQFTAPPTPYGATYAWPKDIGPMLTGDRFHSFTPGLAAGDLFDTQAVFNVHYEQL